MDLTKKVRIPEGKVMLLPKSLNKKRLIDSSDEIEMWKLLVASIGNILANEYILNISCKIIDPQNSDPNEKLLKEDLEQEVLELNGKKYLTKSLNRKVSKVDFNLSLHKYFKDEIDIIKNCFSILNPSDAKRLEHLIFRLICESNQDIGKNVNDKWFLEDIFDDVYLGTQYKPEFKELIEGVRINKLTHGFKKNYNEEFKFIYENIKNKLTTNLNITDISKYKKMGYSMLEIFKAWNIYKDVGYILNVNEKIKNDFRFELDNLKNEMIFDINKTCSNTTSLTEEFYSLKESEVMRYLSEYLKIYKEIKEKNGEFNIKDFHDTFQSFSHEVLKLFYASENKNYKVISGLMNNCCLEVEGLTKTYGPEFQIDVEKYKKFKDKLFTIENNTINLNEDTYKMVRVILRSENSLKEALGSEFQKKISQNFKNEKNNNSNVSNNVNLTLINRLSIDERDLINEYKKLSAYIKEKDCSFLKEDLNHLLLSFKNKTSLGKGLSNTVFKIFEGLNINIDFNIKIKEENDQYTLYHCLEFKDLQYPIEEIKEIMWDITLNNFIILDKDNKDYDEVVSIYQKYLMKLDKNLNTKKSKLKKF